MFNDNKNKIFFGILLLVLFFNFLSIDKGTYSNINLDDVIVFDYSLEVNKEEKIIKYIDNGTKISEIINKVSVKGDYLLNVSVTNSVGIKKDDDSVVVTGDLLVISVSDKIEKYEIAVRGDANSDGEVDLVDLVQLRKHLVDWKNPNTGIVENKTGVNLSAIDMNGDEKISLTDLVRLRKIIVEYEENIFLIKTDKDNVNLKVGESKEIKYYVYPSSVSDKNVTWTSSNTSVATVNNGVIKAVGVGDAVITVTTNNSNKQATIKVIVSEIMNYDEPIQPNGNENIIKEGDTDTLKVWIEQVNRSEGRTGFYVTHIWAKDPYNQFKSQVPDNYGKELVTPHNLLKNAVEQNSLDNKLAVAVNASGFVVAGVWGDNYYKVNKEYNNTATCPLVISNGNVIRDFSGKIMPSSVSYTYGLNKNGNLTFYKYPAGEKTEENIAVAKEIQGAGILNTFAFSPVLVWDGKLSDDATDRNIRQGFCQIDKNNFVFITDKYVAARNGFSFKELGEYMISLGCKTGFNLDGGGSTSLIYKEKTGVPEVIITQHRQVADIIYFHE